MLGLVRRMVRKVLPRRRHPLMDAELTLGREDSRRAALYESHILRGATPDDPFIRQRFLEGLRWRHVLESYLSVSDRSRILDIGGGIGAVEFAFSSNPSFWAASIEQLWSNDAQAIHRNANVPFYRSIANAAALPFRSGIFDAVLFLETLEHVDSPEEVGHEIGRVLRDGGRVLILTPPRWRYVLRRDPHFNIWGLVMFPPAIQRLIAERRGFAGQHHYVDRIYSSVPQIARLFPDCEIEAVLSRSRAPQRWFWDAIVLRRSPRIENDRPSAV